MATTGKVSDDGALIRFNQIPNRREQSLDARRRGNDGRENKRQIDARSERTRWYWGEWVAQREGDHSDTDTEHKRCARDDESPSAFRYLFGLGGHWRAWRRWRGLGRGRRKARGSTHFWLLIKWR